MQDFSRNDILDLARWVLNLCLRIHIDGHFPNYDKERDDDAPETRGPESRPSFPTLDVFNDLVPNTESIPQLEIQQYHGLYNLLASLTTSPEKTHSQKPKKPITSLPGSFSELFLSHFKTVDVFISAMCIRQCNGFGLWDKDGVCMGHAVYPFASYFNHDCDPSLSRHTGIHTSEDDVSMEAAVEALGMEDGAGMQAVKAQDIEQHVNKIIRTALEAEPVISFTAARDVSEQEHLTLSYVDSTDVLVRRQELKSVYHFDCKCARCVEELKSIE